KIRIEIRPPARTRMLFKQEKIDIMFPAADETILSTSLKSLPFYDKKSFVFYHVDRPLKKLSDLSGKSVGLTNGYAYTKEILQTPNVAFDYARDDYTNLKKLETGRIDAFIGEYVTAKHAIRTHEIRNIGYDLD